MVIFNISILQNIEISDEIIKGHDGFFPKVIFVNLILIHGHSQVI